MEEIIHKHPNDNLATLSNQKSSFLPLLLVSLVLIGGFSSLLYAFNAVDFYHKHFFDHGLIVAWYQLSRVMLSLYIIWIIYITGYGIISLFVPSEVRWEYSFSDRMIVGFGTGLGAWHILMIILGYYNLYYPSLIAAVCLFILCISIPHFKYSTIKLIQNSRHRFQKDSILPTITSALVLLALLWLLIVRGLYPSGGGDYYTHYFYYYTNVLANHGLAPNDV